MNTTTIADKKPNAAVIAASSGKSVEYREMPGIFSCLLQHKVAETKADFEWNGPPFTKEQWQEMLAFFKWTYATERSEAQVRLFIHPRHGWKIWAFPQDGGTGMTTKEVANDDAKKQREEIGEGYEAFGTIHHHCASPAFQSGTDTHDETTVDGLHITIGKMGEAMHDMHARLYIKSNKFDVNMSAFWDIGDEVRASLKAVKELGFDVSNIEDKAARLQMCVPAPADHPFNAQWKANYLLFKPQVNGSGITTRGYWTQGSVWCNHCMGYPEDKHTTETCPKKPSGGTSGSSRNSQRVWSPADVLEELIQEGVTAGLELNDIDDWIAELTDGQYSVFFQKMFDLCSDNFLKLDQLYKALEEFRKKADEKEEAEAKQEEAELAAKEKAQAEADLAYEEAFAQTHDQARADLAWDEVMGRFIKAKEALEAAKSATGTLTDKMWSQMTPAEREEWEKSQGEIAEQYLMGMQ